MAEDRLLNVDHDIRIPVAWRNGCGHEIVLVHGKTGTALVSKL